MNVGRRALILLAGIGIRYNGTSWTCGLAKVRKETDYVELTQTRSHSSLTQALQDAARRLMHREAVGTNPDGATTIIQLLSRLVAEDLETRPAARATDPTTSHQAAAAARDHAGVQRVRILKHLQQCGMLTADALDEALQMRATSAGRRLPELEALGLARPTEKTARTRSGRQARLWEAVTPQ